MKRKVSLLLLVCLLLNVLCFFLGMWIFVSGVATVNAGNEKASSTYFEVFRTSGLDPATIDKEITKHNDSAEGIRDRIISYSMYPINSDSGKTIAFLVVIQIRRGKY